MGHGGVGARCAPAPPACPCPTLEAKPHEGGRPRGRAGCRMHVHHFISPELPTHPEHALVLPVHAPCCCSQFAWTVCAALLRVRGALSEAIRAKPGRLAHFKEKQRVREGAVAAVALVRNGDGCRPGGASLRIAKGGASRASRRAGRPLPPVAAPAAGGRDHLAQPSCAPLSAWPPLAATCPSRLLLTAMNAGRPTSTAGGSR